MPSSLFRAEAEDSFDQPDRFAASLRVVQPGVGLLVAALGLLVVCAIVAAFLVRVPIVIKGTGVILSSKGVLQIAVNSGHEGRISQILVDIGSHVVPGQAVARLTQPALEHELLLAEGERDQIAEESAWVSQLQAKATKLSDGVRQQQERNALESIGLLEYRLRILVQLESSQESLRHTGNLTVDRRLQVASQLAEAQERLSGRRSELLGIVLERNEKQAQFDREIQTVATRQAQAERQIRRLQDRLRNETVIQSTEHGIVTELKAAPGDLVKYDTAVLGLLPVDESFAELRPGSARLVAAVLVPAEDGKKIRPGMRVLVDPSSVRRDVYGAIEGVIDRAADIASSPEELRHILRNDDLVRKLTATGAPFMMRVELNRDPATATGFAWTTSSGPEGDITVGTLVEAEIETQHVRIVELLLPALRQWLRGPQDSQTGQRPTQGGHPG